MLIDLGELSKMLGPFWQILVSPGRGVLCFIHLLGAAPIGLN